MWDPRDSEAVAVAGAAVYAGNANGTDVLLGVVDATPADDIVP